MSNTLCSNSAIWRDWRDKEEKIAIFLSSYLYQIVRAYHDCRLWYMGWKQPERAKSVATKIFYQPSTLKLYDNRKAFASQLFYILGTERCRARHRTRRTATMRPTWALCRCRNRCRCRNPCTRASQWRSILTSTTTAYHVSTNISVTYVLMPGHRLPQSMGGHGL